MSLMLAVFNLVWLTLLTSGSAEELRDGPIVTLPNGKIEGLVSRTIGNNSTFHAFLGIPFAASPVGNLRFKPPQPVENWEGILETKGNNKICYQISPKIHRPQTEDCLYLNVFTPVEPHGNDKLPVLISIYGGSFTHGFANSGTLGPDYMLEKGIIVVTFNYRVGPFGYLSTGDDVIPGNMGMKDQVFAMQWVHDNIHLFGGDPDKVTIQGQSAGGASVTYHILSPLSTGLFRGAIANSGSALCVWANQRQYAVDRAYGIASEIDPSFSRKNTSQELLSLLLSVEAEQIHATQNNYQDFAPVIEDEHDGAFITESMYDAVKNGRFNMVPLLIGFNSEEEIAHAGDLDNWRKTVEVFDHNVAKLVNGDMNIEDEEILRAVGQKIKEMYTAGDFVDDLGAGIQFKSDDMFVRAVLRYAELQSNYTDVYVYEFSYHGLLGKNNYSYPGCGKVEHGEEGKYLWASVDLNDYPESDVKTSHRYVGFITNFVKTLDPTPEEEELFQHLRWPKVSPHSYQYMEIDTDLAVKENPREKSYRKWVDIYDSYAVEPLISY